MSGFFNKYYSGDLVLDIGFRGFGNEEGRVIVPHAIGVDRDFPGYNGIRLPFEDGTVDCISSSHCLEHIPWAHAAIRDWYRCLKVGGFISCIVPHQHLYEKREFPPSRYNEEHFHFFTPAKLTKLFEEALGVNTFRVRHLNDNDFGFDYSIGPEEHSGGCYEIEFVIQKIQKPDWTLG